jgi:hypothetical protein
MAAKLENSLKLCSGGFLTEAHWIWVCSKFWLLDRWGAELWILGLGVTFRSVLDHLEVVLCVDINIYLTDYRLSL